MDCSRCNSRAYFFLIATLLAGFWSDACAQKHIEESEQTWFGYFNQTRITERSGVWLDLHYRLTDHYINQRTFFIARVAYIYYVRDNLRLMSGYAFANRYNRDADIVPEHRPWQQFQWVGRYKWFELTQSFRTEQRFRRNAAGGELQEGYNFNWRFRYNFSLAIPLSSRNETDAKTPFVLLSNDVHFNAGKNIVHNYFDQNRSFLGAGYRLSPELNVHAGYLFILQHQGAPRDYLHIHAMRLYIIHNVEIRKQ